MDAWIGQSIAILAAVAVIFVPGLLAGAALRMRGLALWALGAPLGVAILTCGALVFGVLGVAWTPLAALAWSALLAGLALLMGWALRMPGFARRIDGRALRILLASAVVIGCVLVALRVGFYIGAPDAISQTNDAPFHLSALRFATETGIASPLRITEVIGAHGFYPSAWHVLASLVAQIAGVPVEIAANTTSIVIAAGVWPLGLAYLTLAVAGPVAATVAVALSASVSAFPLLLLQWGVLYPQLLATALLPAAIAAVIDGRVLSAGPITGKRERAGAIVRVVLLALAGIGAVVVSQPSVGLIWIVAVLSFWFWALVAGWSASSPRARIVQAGGFVAATAAGALVWAFFAKTTSVAWPPTQGRVEAVVDALTNGFLGYPGALVTSALMVLGLLAAARRADARWLGLSWLGAAGLYILSAAVASPALRQWVLGPWYGDPYRLASLVPVFALPLAGLGGAVAISLLHRVFTRGRTEGWPRAVSLQFGAVAALAAVGVVALASAPQIPRRDVFAGTVDDNLYTASAVSYLSADELELLRRLNETLPDGATAIGNPSTGMSFGYALSGTSVVPRTWTPPRGEAYQVLWASLRDVEQVPAVCDALDAFGARYVLDFGPGEVYPGRWVMPGFDDIEGQPGFELVDAEGDASLWRVTACDEPSASAGGESRR